MFTLRMVAIMAALLAATMPSLPAQAQDVTSEQGVGVQGDVDCGMWAQARAKSASGYLEHYLVGLLDGLALGVGIEFWQAGGHPPVSQQAIFLWIDGYCQENPLDYIVTGAHALYRERSGWRP